MREHDRDDDSLGETWRVVRQAAGTDLRGGLIPFGKRARARREELRRRRARLREETTVGRGPKRRAINPAEITPRRNATVIATGCSIVAGLLALGWWFSSGNDESPQPQQAVPQAPSLPTAPPPSAPQTSVPEGNPGLSPIDPIPPGGVAPIAPRPHTPAANPATVPVVPAPSGPPSTAELSTPESAAQAWMARWCPFDSREPYGAAEQRAQATMTELGWSEFAPRESGRPSWDKRVAAGESAQCSAPQAEIRPEAPRSTTSAIVRITAQQVITGRDGAYVEKLAEQRIVQRGPDGLWRIDTATKGG